MPFPGSSVHQHVRSPQARHRGLVLATELTMPQMGYDMQEGTVVRWLKPEGADVELDEVVAEIETDKATVELPSQAAGVLRRILVQEGVTVPVHTAIAIVGTQDEPLPEVAETPAPEPQAAVEEPPKPAPDPVASAEPRTDAEDSPREVRASPVARRLAEEHGLDLAQIAGTGPGGRITRDDVMAAVSAPEPPRAPAVAAASADGALGDRVPLSRMRQQIARVTVRSKQQIPHYYVSVEVDMTQAVMMRRQINERMKDQGVRISVNDMVIKACVGALKKYPKFNAFFTDDAIQMNETINVGVAIAEEEGLIVPAILDCGGRSISDIAAASRDLADRAKSGTLRPEEYTGATFSISNMGMLDVTSFVAIIVPPQSAVVAVGTVTRTPVVRDDQIAVSDMMTITLSADHRVSDGAEGARFVVEVKDLLQNPYSLLL